MHTNKSPIKACVAAISDTSFASNKSPSKPILVFFKIIFGILFVTRKDWILEMGDEDWDQDCKLE